MSDRPSIGGATGSHPVAMTSSDQVSDSSVPTETVRRPVIRPVPRITVTPEEASRSAAPESSRPPVTSSRRAIASSQASPRLADTSSEFDGRQAR